MANQGQRLSEELQVSCCVNGINFWDPCGGECDRGGRSARWHHPRSYCWSCEITSGDTRGKIKEVPTQWLKMYSKFRRRLWWSQTFALGLSDALVFDGGGLGLVLLVLQILRFLPPHLWRTHKSIRNDPRVTHLTDCKVQNVTRDFYCFNKL